jgi:excisionase family DNA binding protein
MSPADQTPGADNVRLFSEPRAAAYLGVSRRFLQRCREQGIGPAFVKLGIRTIRYPRTSLDEWVRSLPRLPN